MHNLSLALRSFKPMLIEQHKAEAYLSRLSKFSRLDEIKASEMEEMLSMVFGTPAKMEVEDGIAYVPVKGVIGSNLSKLEKFCGAVDVDDIKTWLAQCAEDKSIKMVIMDVDSPGGTVTGVPEAAALYRAIGKVKPTLTWCEGEKCSAAEWIGSQGNESFGTPSSTHGSIGVYVAFPDMSQAFENEGIKMEVIKAGKFKASGVMGTTLTPEQRQYIQDDVNEIHTDFRAAVKSVRSMVKDEDMEGQSFSGKKAASKGIITGMANSIEEALNKSVQF